MTDASTTSGSGSSGSGSSGSGSGAAETKLGEPRAHPMESFGLMVAFIALIVVMFDPLAREWTGNIVGFVLEPLIGFGGSLPVLTILLASVVMVVVTTGVRHYFTDYIAQAKAQDVMRAFNAELKDARKQNNLHKMKKLTEKNQDLMKIQAEQSSAQLRPMLLTMVVVIPIFAWLLVFLDPTSAVHSGVTNPGCESVGRVPWDANWCLDVNIQAKVPPFEWFPRWVAMYSLFSIPVGQVLGRVLKARDLQAELAKLQAEGRA